jgi:acetyl-CoA carboxylase biotin carboxyl carrier protein
MARNVEATVGGQLLKHLVKVGDTITADTEVAMIESMKMHIPVAAELSGKVAKWLIAEGSAVKEGQALLVLEA